MENIAGIVADVVRQSLNSALGVSGQTDNSRNNSDSSAATVNADVSAASSSRSETSKYINI